MPKGGWARSGSPTTPTSIATWPSRRSRPPRPRAANPAHRFLKEAQITGQLEHPNIVPVYELARRKEDDQPFYTMRFLRGQTLRDAIAEFHRRRAGKPADRLELQRQLLEPFVKVCQAVGYAHSRGVIHRDLKPENVVLGAYGEVVVLDWGLAKIVGEARQPNPRNRRSRASRFPSEANATETQGQIGTPAYMAPGTGRGPAWRGRYPDRRLWPGRHPLRDPDRTSSGVRLIGRRSLSQDPGRQPAQGAGSRADAFPARSKPSARKALEHDRRNRYRRAEDLAEDVRRWLLDEPVSVYRDSLAVRLMRWGRRHRTLATSLAALLVTAVIGFRWASCSSTANGPGPNNRSRSRMSSVRSRRPTRRRPCTTFAWPRMPPMACSREVADVDLAEIPQMEPVRLRLLEKAKGGYSQFLVQKGDDPLVRWGAARSLVRLGDIQALLGDVPTAEGSYRKAAAELDDLVKHDPSNVDFQRDLARADHGLGVLLKDANRFQQGEAMLRAGDPAARGDRPEARSDRRGPAGPGRQPLPVGRTSGPAGHDPRRRQAAYQDALEVQEDARAAVWRPPRIPHAAGSISQ